MDSKRVWEVALTVVVALALLAAAEGRYPYSFYMALRTAATVGGVYWVVRVYQAGPRGWMWAFLAVALLLNPILPVRMHRQDCSQSTSFSACSCSAGQGIGSIANGSGPDLRYVVWVANVPSVVTWRVGARRGLRGGWSRTEPRVSMNLKCAADYRCITTLFFSPYIRVFLYRVGNRIVAQPALSCPPLPVWLHVPNNSLA